MVFVRTPYVEQWEQVQWVKVTQTPNFSELWNGEGARAFMWSVFQISKLPSTAPYWAGHWFICTGGSKLASVLTIALGMQTSTASWRTGCSKTGRSGRTTSTTTRCSKHAKTCDNVLLVNYDTMQLDLAGVVLKLGEFLSLKCGWEFWDLLQHLAPFLFRLPEARWGVVRPAFGIPQARTFIHKGVSRRW